MSTIPFTDVAEIVMGQSPEGDTYNRDRQGVPLLNGPAEFGENHPIAVQWTTAPARMARQGDILFCVRGNTLGRQNIADREYAIGRGLAAIRAKEGKGDALFVSLWLRFKAREILASGTGSTFPSISGDNLASLRFPNISEADQHALAVQLNNQLDLVNAALSAARTQVRELALLPQKFLAQAFNS